MQLSRTFRDPLIPVPVRKRETKHSNARFSYLSRWLLVRNEQLINFSFAFPLSCPALANEITLITSFHRGEEIRCSRESLHRVKLLQLPKSSSLVKNCVYQDRPGNHFTVSNDERRQDGGKLRLYESKSREDFRSKKDNRGEGRELRENASFER